MHHNAITHGLLHDLKAWVISGLDEPRLASHPSSKQIDSPGNGFRGYWFRDNPASNTDVVFFEGMPVDREPVQDLGDQLRSITRDATSRGNQCELILQSPTLQVRKTLVQLGAEPKHSFEGMVCQSRTAQANHLEFVAIDSPGTFEASDLRKTVSMIHPDLDTRSQNAISNQILRRSMNPDCKQFFVKNRVAFFATVAIHFGRTTGRQPLAGIHDLFVEASSRKQNYGSQILHTTIDHIHRKNETSFLCAVFADKSVTPFYRKHGFETICSFQRWLVRPQPCPPQFAKN